MIPVVSIIVPVHNSAPFLPGLFSNLKEMTFTSWECICINNRSSDNSLSVLHQLAKEDSRFRIQDSSESGVSNARNLGMKLAQGNYIQFLDADDQLAEKKLELHAEYLFKHPEIGLVFSNAVYFKEEAPLQFLAPPWSKSSLYAISGEGNTVFKELLKGNRLVISAPLFRKEVVIKTGLMNAEMIYNEDWDFWLRLAKAGVYFKFIDDPECISKILLHSRSSSTNLTGMYASELAIYRREASDKGNKNQIRTLALRYFFQTWMEAVKRKLLGSKIDLLKLNKGLR
jgi:glycosyltransferase involved in cell wall biosynthesis